MIFDIQLIRVFDYTDCSDRKRESVGWRGGGGEGEGGGGGGEWGEREGERGRAKTVSAD